MIQALDPPIIKQLTSNQVGKRLAIMVGIHGNEKGPQYEWEWLQKLPIQTGSVALIFANPTASRLNKRYVNINLNRRFGLCLNEYPEDTIAREIEKILEHCDALLDLHMYNEAMDRPFAICNPKSNAVAKRLPVNYIVNLPSDHVGGGSDEFMAQHGKIGVCFETGSSERPHDYATTIRKGVTAFLAYYGILEPSDTIGTNPIVLKKDITKIVKSEGIRFSKTYASFDTIRKDEVICVENGKAFTPNRDGYILFPRPQNPVGTEAYYTLIE